MKTHNAVPTMRTLQTILHPTDFSESSRYAFETACSLVRDKNTRLIVLHVGLPSVAPIPFEPVPNPLVPAESQEFLSGRYIWPQPPDPTMIVEHRVAEGEAAAEILRLAKALKCDLIVMGTHGRTGFSRFLTGSVAEEVLRKAVCPVLAVKTPLPEASPVEAEPRAKPGEVVDLRRSGPALTKIQSDKLVRAEGFEIIRLFVPAAKEIAEHKAQGTLIVECCEGRVAFSALGKTQNLQAGELLFLPAGEPHSLKGINDASLLLTLLPTTH
jgi:nucleotide-binding universal stress UspA family protein/quercetin dioxygenase-like cupin family protein